MSSIHEALSRDIHRNSGFPKPNQVVLKSHQERLDGPIGGDFFARKAIEHEQARAMRRAEGGRGGGYNDRQEVMHGKRALPSDAVEEGLDEFGRRRSRLDSGLSRAARAEAALQRIRRGAGGRRGRDSASRSPARPGRGNSEEPARERPQVAPASVQGDGSGRSRPRSPTRSRSPRERRASKG
mmetsp:Transcript_22044/g.62626  ORF Transcript_22044/g.62626 Transcript_22044/m.62626 type:complete len:183 (-) Transcript_22044:96-644(-)